MELGQRVATLETTAKAVDERLWGANGRVGEIPSIQSDVSMLKRDRLILIVAFGAFQMATGNGWLTLDNFLKFIHH